MRVVGKHSQLGLIGDLKLLLLPRGGVSNVELRGKKEGRGVSGGTWTNDAMAQAGDERKNPERDPGEAPVRTVRSRSLGRLGT